MSKFATREQNLEASVLSSWVKEYKPPKMPSKVRRKKERKKLTNGAEIYNLYRQFPTKHYFPFYKTVRFYTT